MDPWLEPFKDGLKSRFSKAQKWLKTINETEGGLEKFSRGYEKYGLIAQPNGDIIYREWAPNALRAYLIGDFNHWNRDSHQMTKDTFGVFHITLPSVNGQPAIPHDSKIKISFVVPNDHARAERLPRRVGPRGGRRLFPRWALGRAAVGAVSPALRAGQGEAWL